MGSPTGKRGASGFGEASGSRGRVVAFWLRPVPARLNPRPGRPPWAPSGRPLGTSIAAAIGGAAQARRSCVESVIGVEGGQEGIKLEAQVPITEGVEMLSSYPMEEDWL